MSARQVRPEFDCHVFRARDNGSEVILVGGGRLAYLSFAPTPGNLTGSLSGPQTLRALAKAILKEIPDTRKRKRP